MGRRKGGRASLAIMITGEHIVCCAIPHYHGLHQWQFKLLWSPTLESLIINNTSCGDKKVKLGICWNMYYITELYPASYPGPLLCVCDEAPLHTHVLWYISIKHAQRLCPKCCWHMYITLSFRKNLRSSPSSNIHTLYYTTVLYHQCPSLHIYTCCGASCSISWCHTTVARGHGQDTT